MGEGVEGGGGRKRERVDIWHLAKGKHEWRPRHEKRKISKNTLRDLKGRRGMKQDENHERDSI